MKIGKNLEVELQRQGEISIKITNPLINIVFLSKEESEELHRSLSRLLYKSRIEDSRLNPLNLPHVNKPTNKK